MVGTIPGVLTRLAGFDPTYCLKLRPEGSEMSGWPPPCIAARGNIWRVGGSR